MCLAKPARVVEVTGDGHATVEQDGTVRTVSVVATPEVTVGSYVLINLGVAAKVLSEAEAREITQLWDQLSARFSADLEAADPWQI